MKPHIDPKVDCVFKAILGQPEHRRLLRHFLNAVLAADAGIRIQEVDIQNPYNEREFETDKLSVVDVKARDEAGRWYQVEIQLTTHPGLTSRMLYTWSSIYHGQLKQGQEFSALTPVIAIWLLNETLFAPRGAYHLPFVVWNRQHGVTLCDDLRIHVLQLTEWALAGQARDDLDRWLYLFRHGEEVDTDAPPAILQTDEMQEAMGVLQHFSENTRNYLLYQTRLEAQHVEASWKGEIARWQNVAAEAAQQAERERQEKEAERARAERERQEKEAERARAERERHEKEQLLALLKQAGIDPAALSGGAWNVR